MMAEPAWDRGLIHRVVRARHRYYTDVVTRLMREEAKLLPKGGDQTREQIIQLASTIDQIEKLGGDATATKTARDALIKAREIHEPKLARVQAALSAARECMKWADMAHEGMHWLCFAEPRLEIAAEALPVASREAESSPRQVERDKSREDSKS